MDDIEHGGDPFSETMRLGVALRSYRRYARLSQHDLARESLIDQSNLSKIESGQIASPTDFTLETIAAALARQIPGADPKEIFNHLKEAKSRKPASYTSMTPEGVLISDRLKVHSLRFRQVAYELISRMLDALEEIASLRGG